MSKVYISTQLTKDIDWFCRINNIYIHVASAGGLLPDIVNSYERLNASQQHVALLPDINEDNEIHINANLRGCIGNANLENYLPSFKMMAKKGFYSFDRTNICNPEDNRYHIVAWPTNIVGDLFDIPMINVDNIHFDMIETLHDINFIDLLNDLAAIERL